MILVSKTYMYVPPSKSQSNSSVLSTPQTSPQINEEKHKLVHTINRSQLHHNIIHFTPHQPQPIQAKIVEYNACITRYQIKY
jgi:hypothetical protein